MSLAGLLSYSQYTYSLFVVCLYAEMTIIAGSRPDVRELLLSSECVAQLAALSPPKHHREAILPARPQHLHNTIVNIFL